ncbi:hypothetical protein GRAQ_04140 [Rahnella aquatilis CIP 78.65 = ATCC 33071]|nr:hypothetical protein GRAQ_04140 [Rahnella aquatilis CIP 78.65 = ATCC 33071]
MDLIKPTGICDLHYKNGNGNNKSQQRSREQDEFHELKNNAIVCL